MPNNPADRRAGAVIVPRANKIVRGGALSEDLAAAQPASSDSSFIASGGGGGGGTVTSITAGTGITLTPNPIVSTGTVAADFGTGAGKVVQGNDSRLSDARTPLAHAASHAAAGSDPVAIAPSQVTGTAVITTDPRLSDARTPTGGAGGDLAGTYPNPTLAVPSSTFVYRARVAVNVKDYGARGDCIELNDGAMTAASATFTSATAAFTAADVGKLMFVAGAGTSGRLIATTISAFTNSTTVTLGAAAVTTVSGAYFYFGTDDTAAFVAALAALPSRRASLYIPQGCYLVPTQSFAGFTGLAIYGDGRFVSTLKSSAFFDAGSGFDTPGGQMLNIAATCSRVDVFALGFDGSCDYRKPGQQCVVIDADYTTFASNYAVNSGEYALTFGRNRTSPKMLDLQVIGNRVGPSFADGINVYQTAGALIANNIVDGADDDLIAVGESTGVNIVGNILTARTDLGTTWGRGIAILAGCDGITGSGNSVLTCKQWGLWIASEGGTRIANVHLTGTTLTNCPTVLGPSCVGVFETDNVTLVGTCINNPPYGYGFLIADYNNLSIQGGRIFQEAAVFFHGIRTDPNTTYNGSISFATTWTGLSIEDVQITAPANVLAACIGLYPHSTMTMDTILIQGVKSRQGAAGPYIDIDSARCATVVKVVNNTSMEGRAVNPGAGGIFTVANNN